MLLSYLVCAMFFFFAAVALVCRQTGLAEATGWEWSHLVWPTAAADWALVSAHCVCAFGGQLVTAAGYSTTRAGIAAFLQLTELAWTYLLDAAVLREPTSLLASLGSAVVFVGAVAAVTGDTRAPERGK